jgi:hypothetical protein
MKGYVKNMTPLWAHALKRAVGPGQKIPLDELFAQYGAKHNLSEGEEFIRWLKDVKLRDNNKWQVVLETKESQNEELVKERKAVLLAKGEIESRGENVAPPVSTKLGVADIVSLSVRRAKEILPTFNDIATLKYAASEANQLSGKDSLCRMIRKRIQELEVTRRR